MPKSKLPPLNTEEWKREVKAYLKSDIKWRRKRAKELGFTNFQSYQKAINNRGILLPDDIKHKAFARDNPKSTVPIQTDYQLPPDSTWKEHIDAIRGLNKLVDYHQRLPQEVTLMISTRLPIGIVWSADWQLGQFGVDYDSFEKDMSIVEIEPGVYINVGGDTIYNIIQASKIGSSHNQVPVAVQKGLCVLTLKMLINKLATVKTGNHEYFDAVLTGEDWLGERAKQMKLVYIKHGGRINYVIGNQTYSEFAIHKGRYNSSFNQTHSNKQYQRLHAPWARIITIEHLHIADVEQYQYDNKECVAIRPGTYAVYDDYAQQNGFFGAHVCNPMVVMFPNKDKVVPFKDMYEGIEYLRAVRKGKVNFAL